MGPWILTSVALAGTWGTNHVLQGVFGVSSPPEQPVVAVSSSGHAIAAWDDLGDIRFSARSPGGSWTKSAKVHRGAYGGPVQVAIGSDDTAAAAWITVASEFVPAYLVASVRAPGGSFPAPLTVALGEGVWWFDLGVAGDGTVTIAWGDATGIEVSALPPGASAWSAPALASDASVGATFPDLAVDDAGDALIAWIQGADVGSAYLPAGGTWEAPVIVSIGAQSWSPHAALDGAGDAAIGFVQDYAMVVADRPAGGAWSVPEAVSDPSVAVYSGAFAMDALGDALAAWQVLDAANVGSIWSATRASGGAWTAGARLSRPLDSAEWPVAAYSDDGSVAAVSWIDDAAVAARCSIGTPSGSGLSWIRQALGDGSWGSSVPVAAGGGTVAAAWALQLKSNPNAAKIVARVWE